MIAESDPNHDGKITYEEFFIFIYNNLLTLCYLRNIVHIRFSVRLKFFRLYTSATPKVSSFTRIDPLEKSITIQIVRAIQFLCI